MEQIRKFLRDKGFALALLACLVAAAAAGVWAVRTVRDELDKNLSGLKTPDSTSTARRPLTFQLISFISCSFLMPDILFSMRRSSCAPQSR